MAKIMNGFSTNIHELASESASASNEPLRQAVNFALMAALENELEQACTVDELWSVFRDALTQFQRAVFLNAMTESIRDRVFSEIMNRDYDAIRSEAISAIIEGEEDALFTDALNSINKNREANKDFFLRLEEHLKSEMRESVAENLRQELMNDESFIEAVKTDLKKTILGL
jgi:hypothetical protein